MRRTALVVAAAVSMAAGSAFAQNASQAQRVAALIHEYAAPQKVIAALDTRDQKFNSPGCQEARKNAQGYEDMTGARVALAVGASVALALVGAPVMVVPNPSSEGARRERINRGLVSHCASNAPAIFAALDVMRERAAAKWDDRVSEIEATW